VVQVGYVAAIRASQLWPHNSHYRSRRVWRYLPELGLYPTQSTFKKAHRVFEYIPTCLQIMDYWSKSECWLWRKWSKEAEGLPTAWAKDDFFWWKKNKIDWLQGWGKSKQVRKSRLLIRKEKDSLFGLKNHPLSLLELGLRQLPSMKNPMEFKKNIWLSQSDDYGKAAKEKNSVVVGSGAIGGRVCPTSISLIAYWAFTIVELLGQNRPCRRMWRFPKHWKKSIRNQESPLVTSSEVTAVDIKRVLVAKWL